MHYIVNFHAKAEKWGAFAGLVHAKTPEEAKQKAFNMDFVDIEEIEMDHHEITEVDEACGFSIKTLGGQEHGVHYRTD